MLTMADVRSSSVHQCSHCNGVIGQLSCLFIPKCRLSPKRPPCGARCTGFFDCILNNIGNELFGNCVEATDTAQTLPIKDSQDHRKEKQRTANDHPSLGVKLLDDTVPAKNTVCEFVDMCRTITAGSFDQIILCEPVATLAKCHNNKYMVKSIDTLETDSKDKL